MSEQETPRTVEEAALEEAERRWPMTDQERAMVSFGVQFAQQAARMPSAEEVAEVLCGPPFACDRCTRKAEQVAALWGGGERG